MQSCSSGQSARCHLQDVLLGSVEEEDHAVVKRGGLVGQRVEDLQHHSAAHRVVAGSCGRGRGGGAKDAQWDCE